MRELSVEEKAKAYDEAIEKLRDFYRDYDTVSHLIDVKEELANLFPELVESEDEKIRKKLKHYLEVKRCQTNDDDEYINCNYFLTWLEKQGGRKSKKVPIWKHWKDGIAGNGEGKPIYLIKDGDAYRISSVLGCECDYILLSDLDKLMLQEKQGEQKPIAKIQLGKKYKCIASPRYTTFMIGEIYKPEDKFLCSLMNFCYNCFELIEDGEQKPSDKVEPKFKDGDWVVFNDKHESVYQIEKIENFQYILRHILGGSMPLSFSGEDMIRPWAIQDAKDGDVLAGSKGEVILMFRGIGNTEWDDVIDYYCYYDCHYKDFIVQEGIEYWGNIVNNQLKPATKEQRDILFSKMKEAGYEWDENNKILKEIVEDEEEPQNYKNQVMSEIIDLVKHYIKQKPACSEASEDIKEALRTEYEKGRADAFAQMQMQSGVKRMK